MTITKIKNGTSARFAIGDDADPQYAKAWAHEQAGVPWKQITGITGVGYDGGWVFCRRSEFAASGGLIDLTDLTVAQAKPIVAQHRANGESWGLISARCGISEGQVRKLFTEATNVDHQGLRNGHGGRFYQNNASAYAPAPKVGWVRNHAEDGSLPEFILAGLLKAGAIEQADVTELQGMTLKALKAMAASLGLAQAGTKKDLVTRVAKAFASDAA